MVVKKTGTLVKAASMKGVFETVVHYIKVVADFVTKSGKQGAE